MINKVYYLKHLDFLLHCKMLRHDNRFVFCVVSVGDIDYIVGYTDSNYVIVLNNKFYAIYDKFFSLNIVCDIPKFKSIPANEIHFVNNDMLNDSYFFVKDKCYCRWVNYKDLIVFVETVYSDFKNGNENLTISVYDPNTADNNSNVYDVYNKLYADSSCEENNNQDTNIYEDLFTTIMANSNATDFDLNYLSDSGDQNVTSNFKGCINNSTDTTNIHSSNDLLPNDDITKLADIVAKERNSQWGDTYKRIAPIAKEVLGLDMTTQQFCGLMILMKLMRWKASDFKSKDCLVDIINYAKLADN